MQKLDRLSKVGIVAIIVIALVGGAGVWWWSKQPLESVKADPPVTTPAPAPVSVTTPGGQEPETARALEAYVSYEKKYVEMAKAGGDQAVMDQLLQLVTVDGTEREISLEAQRQYRASPLVVRRGESRLASSSVVQRGTEDPADGVLAEIKFHACWDGSSLEVDGAEPPMALATEPVLHRVDGTWLVHSMESKTVDSCV